tara:strand:- start:5149 stop:5961 length:813 start_codon:yes stop_codon:yes gene_type:complete
MNNCYKIKTINKNKGVFDNSIDATYIIYLEGNIKRLNSIKEQLSNITPTKKIHILINKGWRKSKKNSYITNTAKDLVDCNITCFRHAKKYNYNNILILEDDFIFDNINNFDSSIINNFLKDNINNKISFYLGTLPFVFIPYSKYIYRGIINIYTHSVVFTKKIREDILNYNYKTIFCWDIFQNYYNYNKYYYHKPLCFQIIEETDNSKNWPVFSFIRILWFRLVYLLNANIKPKLFFKLIYILSYVISISFLAILLYILYFLKFKIPHIL